MFRCISSPIARRDTLSALGMFAGLIALGLIGSGVGSATGWWFGAGALLLLLMGRRPVPSRFATDSWVERIPKMPVSDRKPLNDQELGPNSSQVAKFLAHVRRISDADWKRLGQLDDEARGIVQLSREVRANRLLHRALASAAGKARTEAYEAALAELYWIVRDKGAEGVAVSTYAVLHTSTVLAALVHRDLLNSHTFTHVYAEFEPFIPLASVEG